ncbi:DUF333 domain-containing protein [Halomonas dongshanensis]|uniref:DUF333 domain-containing protein n=1 Tax=Halomonas dongshanensis TaxID=2890835 RepID=A0ABT2EC67_9GAMM|nr:DUF333 domain-containing protein [Halomonas dongshanensis]MCS2609177.1 DUF333 domain-containing protein [Halomonas dongshanensis]
MTRFHATTLAALPLVALLLSGCSTLTSEQNAQEAQRYAVAYCEREGGEVHTRETSDGTRQYCHLMEGRVVEVNMLYRTEGLRPY